MYDECQYGGVLELKGLTTALTFRVFEFTGGAMLFLTTESGIVVAGLFFRPPFSILSCSRVS